MQAWRYLQRCVVFVSRHASSDFLATERLTRLTRIGLKWDILLARLIVTGDFYEREKNNLMHVLSFLHRRHPASKYSSSFTIRKRTSRTDMLLVCDGLTDAAQLLSEQVRFFHYCQAYTILVSFLKVTILSETVVPFYHLVHGGLHIIRFLWPLCVHSIYAFA